MVFQLAFLYLSLAGAPTWAWDVPAEWSAFKVRFGRTYEGDEETARFVTFQANLRFIDSENANGHKYTLGISQFADRFPEELGYGLTPNRDLSLDGLQIFEPNLTQYKSLPSSIDWEEQGATTPVVDENMAPNGYGACWAFAAVAAVESAEKIVNGRLVKLSEQQIVDCSGGGTCTGGGDPWAALKWARSKGTALCTEESYPYTCFAGSDGCRTSCAPGLPPHSVSGIMHVQRSEQGLMAALMQQPVVGAMAGAWHDPTCDPHSGHCLNHPHFQFYTGGVYSNPDCTQLDHAVLVVGYGKTASGDAYWKIKNSYGPKWGMNGYALLKRGPAGQSGSADSCGVPGLLAFPNLRKTAVNQLVV